MAKQPAPRVRMTLPPATKVPLGSYIEQLQVAGMSPEQTRESALLIQSGKAGYPTGKQ